MSAHESVGELVGNRYQLHEKLGAGGMGAVYRAIDRLTGKTVALKRVLLEHTDAAPTGSRRELRLSIAREFRTLASLHHPHIIAVSDYGFDANGHPYFTMDLLLGAQTLLEAASDVAAPVKVRLLIDLLRALAYIHRRGIVHRDLKPANVLVDDEQVYVLDFGLAMEGISVRDEEGTSGIAGTIAYMAPELLLEEPATPASDLYAVGLMAYEILTGRYPFDRGDTGSLVGEILQRLPDTSALHVDTARVIDRMLAKQPAERFQSADDVIVALCAAAGQPVPVETAEIRESFLQASAFVGRELELGQLLDALNTMLETGAGSSWLIGGESGVGKSRLLEELRIQAQIRGVLILRGQGVADGGAPFQVWREAARRLALSTPLSTLEAGVLKAIVPDIGALLGNNVAAAPELDAKNAAQRL